MGYLYKLKDKNTSIVYMADKKDDWVEPKEDPTSFNKIKSILDQ